MLNGDPVGDVRDPLALTDAVRSYGFRRIIHTAAFPGFSLTARQAPFLTIEVNIMGGLTCWRLAGSCSSTGSSSAARRPSTSTSRRGMAGQALDGWIRAALAGQRVQVAWPRLEWLYAKDAARGATLAWWGDGLAGRVFNVGMGCGVSAADIAAAIRAVVPDAPLTSAEVVDDGRGVLSGEKFAMNPDRARRDLGYELAFGLAAAISGYVAWLRARPS